jgi:glycosyltransferase involved in cell wall biosynthesis
VRVCVIVDNELTLDVRVLRQVGALRGAGYDVTVVALEDRQPQYLPDLAGATLLTVPSFGGLDIRRKLAEDAGTEDVAAAGTSSAFRHAATRSLTRLSNAIGPYRYGRRAWYLGRPAVSVRPDICHANNLSSLPAAIACKVRFGSKVIYDAHELETHRAGMSKFARLRAGLVERALIRHTDRVITVSDSIAAYLAGRYGIRVPQVVRNVAAVSASAKTIDTGSSKSAGMTILHLGLIGPRRGLEQLIDALPLVEGVRARFVGPGSEYSAVLRDRARERGVLDRFEIEDLVPPDAVNSLMTDVDAGYCGTTDTPLSYRFSLPNKLFSYLAAGVPVVASDLPEVRSLLGGTGAGALFELRSLESLAAAIRAVMCGDRVALRERARKLAEANSWEREQQRLLDVYAELSSK